MTEDSLCSLHGHGFLIDDQVGRILDALEQTGQADNTLVVFMSDHGEMLGDHGIYFKGPHFYDCQMRVPSNYEMARWWTFEKPTGRWVC